MKTLSLPFLVALLILSFFLVAQASSRARPVLLVTCRALRDDPGAPTYGFELVRQSNGSYEARYLDYPGNEDLPSEVKVRVADLKCKFLSNRGFYFQCLRFGASAESVFIHEQKLSLIADRLQVDYFREFRLIGTDVPGGYLVTRFASADLCSVKR